MTASPTIYLDDYQPVEFSINTIYLTVDLYDDHALVENCLDIERASLSPLYFYGEYLELIQIKLNERLLTADEYTQTPEGLTLNPAEKAFKLSISTRIYPQKNTQLSGLYRSNNLFCTQCEAEGFRRITYFPDRPDVLTTFTTRISADKAQFPVLLSNGNLIEQGEDVKSGRHWVIWHDPFKKPCYLFALVAGNLAFIEDEFTTQSGRAVTLKIFVEPGQEDKCDYAMQSIKHAMRWDEQVYGLEYDLSIFMIVAVSDFNMGAMENKGLNIFNSKYILASFATATDQDFMGVEGVVAHEYFHNWTGNRVTCRDWFQLSLKEGLTVFRDQEFSRDMNSRAVNRIQDVKVLRASQFPEDASAMAHPVRPSSYQEINNFYTATIYNKGAEVIRMQHTLLGASGFRKGMDLYFARHDGQAVTIDDFVAAMEDANQVDFSQLKRWYSQAGTPEVDVQSEFSDNTLRLTLKQTCRPTAENQYKEPFHIPINIALYDKQGGLLPLDTACLELREREQTFLFTNLNDKPLISLLRDFSAPIKLHQTMTDDERIALLMFETDGYAQWDNAQNLAIHAIHQSLAESLTLSTELVQAFRSVLTDDSLDKQLRAEIICPPGFEETIANLTIVDPMAVENARDDYRQQLGLALYPDLLTIYQQLSQSTSSEITADAIALRRLKNGCLWLMMKSNPESLSQAVLQFKSALSMTDQLMAFNLICSSPDNQVRQDAIDSFYQQWSHDDLVLDKWFSMQATSELPSTLKLVRQLMQHPAFEIKNPNKVRSLIGAFVHNNPRNFHQIDGSGYQFLTEMIVQLDALNPQIAARLATPFTRWTRFDPVRQGLMKDQLLYLSSQSLSRDTAEIVLKSLQG